MKIFGIGVDIVENNRFKKLIKKKRFISRICSPKEIDNFKKKNNKISYLSKRFSAKEALFKALGIHNKLSFLDVEVRNNMSGLPNFRIKGNSLKNLKFIYLFRMMIHGLSLRLSYLYMTNLC